MRLLRMDSRSLFVLPVMATVLAGCADRKQPTAPAPPAPTLDVVPGPCVVASTADDGVGSLRAAIANVACATITFDPVLDGQQITLTTGQLAISRNVAIQGPGSTKLGVARSQDGGTPGFRIFSIGSATVSISGLTIARGKVSGVNGGGILNVGTLTLTDVRVVSNETTLEGGGIYSSGAATLTIVNSSIVANSSDQDGGGITLSNGLLKVTGTTVSHNGAETRGGGLAVINGNAELTNATVSMNRATGSPTPSENAGGGIVIANGLVTLDHVTVTKNEANGNGNGIFLGGGGALTLRGTIVADNWIFASTTAGDIASLGTETITANYSMFSKARSVGLSEASGNNTILDLPGLGPLSDNGGPTQTHALLSGSPAINAGNNDDCPATDQRGLPRARTVADPCDIGAYEVARIPTATGLTSKPSYPVGTTILVGGGAWIPSTGALVTEGSITLIEGGTCALPGTTLGTSTVASSNGAVFFTIDRTSTGVLLGVGTHTLTGCYSGTTLLAPSSGDVTFDVTSSATTTTVSASSSQVAFGSSVTFTGTVKIEGSVTAVTEGTVRFIEGGDCLTPGTTFTGELALDGSGAASFGTNALLPGAHTIVACYTTSGAGFERSQGSVQVIVFPPLTSVSLTISPSTQQYSDSVTLTARVTTSIPLPVVPSGSVSFSLSIDDGLPATLASVSVANSTASFVYKIGEPAGAKLAFEARFISSRPDVYAHSANQGRAAVVVVRESATVRPADGNPTALQVSSAGGSLNANALMLAFSVQETSPDLDALIAGPGDLANAGLTVTLAPVGPGTTQSLTCTPGTVTGNGYAALRPFSCTNSNPIPVNAYEVQANVAGNFYTGSYSDVLAVFDPSLGSASGGGTFTLGGDRTTIAFTTRYPKKAKSPQGNLIVVRHHADGTVSKLKANALGALTLGQNDTMGWATLDGKATFTRWDATVGDYVTVGNQSFTLYGEDRADPGANADRVWLSGPAMLSMPGKLSTAATNAATLTSGNLSIPHSGTGRP